jgi:trans-aconitate 2-methyltransferase
MTATLGSFMLMSDRTARQYFGFEGDRMRPLRDILAQVPLGRARRVVDLGVQTR